MNYYNAISHHHRLIRLCGYDHMQSGAYIVTIWSHDSHLFGGVVDEKMEWNTIHRDYTFPADIQIRLEEDWLDVWNPGELPPPLTPEKLYGPHASVLRNPLLAQAFYFAGIIELWGTGTTRIIGLCQKQGLPEPEFTNWQGGFRLTFLKDPYTPERLRAMGLNERQIKAVLYVKERGSISNQEYRQLTGLKERMTTIELADLVKKGVLVRIGKTGRGTRYAVKKAQKEQ